MPTGTFEYQSQEEKALTEQAIAFVTEIRHLAQAAPAGAALAACEARALDSGRRRPRDALEAAAPARIDAAERKGARRAAARAPAATA